VEIVVHSKKPHLTPSVAETSIELDADHDQFI